MTRRPESRSEQLELVVNAHALVGEGPTWDPVDGVLYWVDVLGGVVHRYDPRDGNNATFAVPQTVGAVAPRRGGGLLMAVRDGFALWSERDGLRLVAPVEAEIAANRMNDGKCDPRGRFWAGTMADDSSAGAGSLYRIDPDHHVTKHLDGLTVSNGLDWSPDGKTMYFIDSKTQRVDAFDYDVTSGTPSGRRTLVDIPEDLGLPDGMATDCDGYLWVAMCFGWTVRRYAPDGALDRIIRLPTKVVTSCGFGGVGMDALYITTGVATLSEDELRDQSSAGGVFKGNFGVRGQVPRLFEG